MLFRIKQDEEKRRKDCQIKKIKKIERLQNVDAAVVLLYALLVSEYGGDASAYCKAAF